MHPIFGAFLAGLIIPHEGGFAIALVEKIDDLVALLFLPIVRISCFLVALRKLTSSTSYCLVCPPTLA